MKAKLVSEAFTLSGPTQSEYETTDQYVFDKKVESDKKQFIEMCKTLNTQLKDKLVTHDIQDFTNTNPVEKRSTICDIFNMIIGLGEPVFNRETGNNDAGFVRIVIRAELFGTSIKEESNGHKNTVLFHMAYEIGAKEDLKEIAIWQAVYMISDYSGDLENTMVEELASGKVFDRLLDELDHKIESYEIRIREDIFNFLD